MSRTRSLDEARREIVARVAEALDVAPDSIDPSAPFATYGLASRDAVMLSGDLEEWFGSRLPPTLFYDYPSADQLARHLTTLHEAAPRPGFREPDGVPPIAIIGIGCRFPQARDAADLTRLLAAGTDAIATMPGSRRTLLGPDALEEIPSYALWGGFVEDVDAFDAPFFGIGGAEAASMDPQHRWLLELAWEALEDAGQPPDTLAGSQTGVFVGISTSDYGLLRLRRGSTRDLDAYFGTSNSPSVAAGRVAYHFGFHGPTMAVDTACSSSLVAVHLACQSLRARECDMALAAGVNLMLAPDTTVWASRARILSESGRCRTFDRAADGYVRGEGCGVVVLKRLPDALAGRDRILAIIRGSAVNHDGRTSGLTAPNGTAQQRVILAALAQAGVAPEQIQYLEAHGTGTVLGDPIEVHAAGAVLCARRDAGDPLVIGSIKTNVGHLEAAAGIAGLIKTAVALGQELIPRHLHLTELNPYIADERLPIAVADGTQAWKPGETRLAGVSAFGLSGTNAHVVLESAPTPDRAPSLVGSATFHLLPISGRTANARRAYAAAYASHLQKETVAIEDVCYTASVRRSHHRYRLAAWGADGAAVAAALVAWLSGDASADAIEGVAASGTLDEAPLHVVIPLSGKDAGHLSRHYCRGAQICWTELYPSDWIPVALPRYPFERSRYWFHDAPETIRQRLNAAPGEQYPVLVRAYVIEEVSKCLEASGDRLDTACPLSALGLDSLMAIDLSNKLAVDLDLAVSPLTLLDGMTVEGILDAAVTRRGGADIPSRPPLPAPAAEGAPFPLSQAQERIWILDQLAGAQAAYIIPSAVLVRGALDASRLEGALAAAVRRHDALRTCIEVADGRPLQRVRPSFEVSLRVIDLQGLPAGDRSAEAAERAANEAAQPFDLLNGPLFRTTLYRLAPDEHLWSVAIHHIIADGSSLAILMREVLQCYDGQPVDSRSLPAHYSQFVAWEQERAASVDLRQNEDAARRTIEGAAPLNLPTDRTRTADRSFDGSSVPLHVPADVSAGLRGVALDRQTTLNTVLLAAFQALLGRCAQQREVLVGTPLGNRTRPEFENLVGCFANTGVIRTDVGPERPFAAVMRDVHSHVREAWARQEVAFGRLVTALDWREPGRNPFFDAFFALNVPTPQVAAGGVTFQPTFLTARAAKFDLALFVEDRPDGIEGFLEYRHDLFDRQTVSRLLRRFLNLVTAVVISPDAAVGDLRLLDAEDRQVIEAFGDPAAVAFSSRACLHDLVRAQAGRTPEAVAISDDHASVTYRELEEQSGAVAAALVSRGIGPGGVVAIAMERSIDLPVTMLGVLKAGAAYLPLDPGLPRDRIRAVIESAGAVLIERRPTGLATSPQRTAEVLPRDLAYVIYTSGSTGAPKGVEITHRNVVNLLESMARAPGISPGDVLLAVTPVTFDIAALELFLPLIAGARVAVASRATASEGARLAASIHATGATIMQATPATWRLLAEAGFRPDARLKVLCGGEALPPDLAAYLTGGGAQVWNMYGPTETTIWSTILCLRPGELPSLGRPIANTRIRVADAGARAVPPGSVGEICIGGEGVGRGYRHQPDLSAERFIIDPERADGARLYRTGDLGCLRPDGTLWFVGRSDDQVKIRGFRVEPAEIEAVLSGCAGVRQAAVAAHRVSDHDVRLIAFVATDAGGLRPERYRAAVADRLPAYMMPSTFTGVDTLPLTPNGKIDRRALAAAAAAAIAGAAIESRPARTPLEADLAGIWARVLGLTEVGVGSSFFDLGGHSLLAAVVIAQVEAAHGVKLPFNLFYTQPTVEEHARYIDAARAAAFATPGAFERLLTMIEGLSDGEAADYLARLDAGAPQRGTP